MKNILPHDLILGIGDSDLQVVGEDIARAHEHSEQTMCDYFSQEKKLVRPGKGVDRYTRWAEDVEIMRAMGVKHYRTSVSMARTLRQDGSPNREALRWYRQYFEALKKADIRIYVTLYHWELPQFLSEQGGWKNRQTIDWFSRHASLVMTELGDLIEEYFILNEPWCSALFGYYVGIQAPGETSLASGLLAAHHHLLAQGRIFRELKARNPQAKIGTVVNRAPFYAHSDSAADQRAARIAAGYLNDWFLDPVYFGRYPAEMVEFYGDAMPKIEAGDMEQIQIGADLYSLGINYYFGSVVRASSTADLAHEEVHLEGGDVTGMGWPITVPPVYPQGLRDVLNGTYERYRHAGLNRIYITENGISFDSKWDRQAKVIPDKQRIHYLNQHLDQLTEAYVDGVPVHGYFVWTLLDNFEWAKAYAPEANFGLYHVDRQTMQRIPKQSAAWYKRVIRDRTIE